MVCFILWNNYEITLKKASNIWIFNFCYFLACSDEQFECGSGGCILQSEVCDTLIQCSDESDEAGCTSKQLYSTLWSNLWSNTLMRNKLIILSKDIFWNIINMDYHIFLFLCHIINSFKSDSGWLSQGILQGFTNTFNSVLWFDVIFNIFFGVGLLCVRLQQPFFGLIWWLYIYTELMKYNMFWFIIMRKIYPKWNNCNLMVNDNLIYSIWK